MNESPSAPPSAGAGVKWRLSVMMFLQYAIWGAWLPILWPFLAGTRGFSATEIGTMFAVGAVGALVAPFVAGQIADRWFATERFLGFSHLAGAVLIWRLAEIESYGGFLVFSLLYSLTYAPTLPLTNAISFHHLPDRDRDFGKVRLFGTLGWIVVGVLVGHWLALRWTPGPGEAAGLLFDREFARAEGRARLLEESRLVLRDKSVLTGKVLSEEGGRLRVRIVGAEGERTVEVPAGEVRERRPLYAALAAEGKAPLLKEALENLGRDAGAEAARTWRGRLLEAGAFAKEALQGPVRARQNEGRADAFRLSALLGLLLGVFCFFLPHTPPSPGKERAAPLEALRELKRQPLATLFLLAVPVSCIHQFYFVHTANFLSGFDLEKPWFTSVFGVGGGGLMTLGQCSEILVLGLLPLVAKRVSRRTLLAVGLLAYALRMALFAHVEEFAALGLPPGLVLPLGVALHGFCFGCFIFVSFMIVDEETPPDVRASAQSLYNLVIVGIGIIAGSMIAAWVQDWATLGSEINYAKLFAVPMWASLACLALLFLFYPRRSPNEALARAERGEA